MSNNQTYTVQLNANDVTSLIKGMSASDHYHKNLPKTDFSYPAELDDILQNNDRIKSILKDALKDTVKVYPKSSETLCPRPPETSDTALNSADDVDGGIFSSSLKSIADQLLIIKSSCTVFNLANFSDEERYLLLEIELRIQELITGQKIICDSENLS